MRAFFSFAVALLMLSACGSGGGSTPNTPPPLANPNGAPGGAVPSRQFTPPQGTWSVSDFSNAVNYCRNYFATNYQGQYSDSGVIAPYCSCFYSQFATQTTFQSFVSNYQNYSQCAQSYASYCNSAYTQPQYNQ